MIQFIFLFVLTNAITFNEWTAKYNKKFTAVEALRRKVIFSANRKYIEEHNKNNQFKLSLDGPFAAMTNEEYRKMLNHNIPTRKEHLPTEEPTHLKKDIPSSIDWREKGGVTPVRDQGSCGSCFAMGAVAAIESRLLVLSQSSYTAETLDLSEQQIVDCCSLASGCNGGTLQAAYKYVKSNGIMLEKDYPYTARDGTCVYDETKTKVSIGGMHEGWPSHDALMEHIAEAPVGVCIDASQTSFQLYKSGVYTEPNCNTIIMNHCVAAVGYGTTAEGKNYYIVKNSWGTDWGEDGYILMSRDDGNLCAILTGVCYPKNVQEI